jgi:hypothetical protein
LAANCTLGNDSSELRDRSKRLGIGNIDKCEDAPEEWCEPDNLFGSKLQFRELCPTICGRCNAIDESEEQPWIAVVFKAAAVCTRSVATSVQVQFRDFFTLKGFDQTKITDIATGCVGDTATESVWARAAFHSVDLARFALQFVPSATATIGGAGVDVSDLTARADVTATTTTTTTTVTTVTTVTNAATAAACDDDNDGFVAQVKLKVHCSFFLQLTIIYARRCA